MELQAQYLDSPPVDTLQPNVRGLGMGHVKFANTAR